MPNAADGDAAGQASGGVLVAGSGAAGLTAALAAAVRGARVTLTERAAGLGGTTALSFGRVWVPPREDPDAAEYLTAVYGDRHPHMIGAFLAYGPRMTEFVQRHSPLRFSRCHGYPDYHPGLPGASPGGRAMDIVPVASETLAGQVRRPPEYLPMTHADWERWRYPPRYDRDVLGDRLRRGILAGGAALAAALLDGVIRSGVRVLTGTRLSGVRLGPDGAVDGARLTGPDGHAMMLSVRAVIMATGGFDRDTKLRGRFLPGAVAATGAPPANTGDALRIAEALGAALGNTGQAWWMPMMPVPGEALDGKPYYRSLIRERALPRQVIVNAAGRRFADEALPYNEFVKAMLGGHGNAPAWMIFDEGYRQRYSAPSPAVRSASLPDLAKAIGVPPDAVTHTVTRWNTRCAAGADPDFGRGSNAYERYMGDPAAHPNPNLGPIDHPPFYAVKVLPGTIGTKGGPVTDTNARVLREDGSPIRGLYAAGNASAFWTSDGYPGPGATLGVAMTMGYQAGRHAGRRITIPGRSS
ncbi:MAG: FAD-dependent oxidoreductase [Streptosporangiaceae bacterium]|nr:FAD-dependent oxidoreductase [Streptosporangiaceae bacterium]MBV9855344.1 FAD-dependent oxidoreductase [Streptosporangiaceae bacterium]